MSDFDRRFARQSARDWLARQHLTAPPVTVPVQKAHERLLAEAFSDGCRAALRRIESLGLSTSDTPDLGAIGRVARATAENLRLQRAFDACSLDAWKTALEELFVQGFTWVSATARGGKIARRKPTP